jgi:hypothetical protein
MTLSDGTTMFQYVLNHINSDATSSDGLVYQHLNLLNKTLSLKHYLDKTCDLNVTKNYYDPKTDRIYIYSLDKLWERIDNVDPRISYNRKLAHFHSDVWNINSFHRLYGSIFSRIQKYEKRGINITLLHDLNSHQYLKYLENIYHLTDIRISNDLSYKHYIDSSFPLDKLNKLIIYLDLEANPVKIGSNRETQITNDYHSIFFQRKLWKYFRLLNKRKNFRRLNKRKIILS